MPQQVNSPDIMSIRVISPAVKLQKVNKWYGAFDVLKNMALRGLVWVDISIFGRDVIFA